MVKLTLEQKRLEALKRQLYGKEPQTQKKPLEKVKPIKEEGTPQEVYLLDRFKRASEISKQNEPQTEVSYLKRDLLKIFMLSAIAITIQTLLFIGLKNNLIRFSW